MSRFNIISLIAFAISLFSPGNISGITSIPANSNDPVKRIQTVDGVIYTLCNDKDEPYWAVTGSTSGLSGNVTIHDEIDNIPVLELHRGAFKNRTGITAVNLPYYMDLGKGAQAFAGCTGLTALSLQGESQQIPDSLALNCTGLKQLEIGYNIRTIGRHAFENCTSIE